MRTLSALGLSALLVAGCSNGPDALDDPTSAAQSAAERSVSYVGGNFLLMLDGLQCGFIQKLSGGDVEGEVATLPAAGDYYTKKHIGNVKYQDFTVQLGLAHSACTDWVKDWLLGKTPRHSGRIVGYDKALREVSVTEFSNALLNEVGFPALDGSSKDPAYLTVKFAPETVRHKAGDGAKLAAPPKAMTGSVGFRLTLDGLDTASVTSIGAMTVKRSAVPGRLEFPALQLSIAEKAARPFYDYFEDFVLRGNHTDDKEKTGVLSFLDPGSKEVFSIDLRGVGIYKLSPRRNKEDKIDSVTVEMYVEQITCKFC